MSGSSCPICDAEPGECRHLVGRMERDEFARVSSGSVVDLNPSLTDTLQSIAVVAACNGKYVWLGDAFAAALDQLRNPGGSPEDIEMTAEEISSQFSYALLDIFGAFDGAVLVDGDNEIACWASNPEGVIATATAELGLLKAELGEIDPGVADDED